MKTKAKLTLAISALSAVVLAAGVTSSFAWLTTQNIAKLNTGEMTVSTVSSLTVDVTKLAYDTSTTGTTDFGTPTALAVDSGQALGVVSSVDGLKFYAPTALHGTDDYVAGNMAEVTDKSGWTGKSNGYVGYMKYGIHVEADEDPGAAKTLHFKITPTVTDTELAASYRVALYKATYNNGYIPGDNIGIYSKNSGSKSGWKYEASAITEGSYTTTAISEVANATAITGITSANPIDHYFIFSVWVEGEDTNATNAGVSGAKLQVELEFSLPSA